jgi:hypothetical protein
VVEPAQTLIAMPSMHARNERDNYQWLAGEDARKYSIENSEGML